MPKRNKSFHDYVLYDLLTGLDGVSSKPMFSGWGVYRNGKIFGIIIEDGLYLKGNEKTSKVFEVGGLPAPRPDAFYVYAIKCDDGSLYIGQAKDLRKRWQEHRSGNAADWTRRHKPLHIAHYEEYSTRDLAVKREKDLKTGFGRQWLKREIKAGRARQAGGVQFEYEKKSHPKPVKLPYWSVPEEVLEDREKLMEWVDLAIEW